MEMNSMMGFLDVIVVCAGLYILYGWYLLVFRNEIKEGLVVSKTVNVKKCKDMEGLKKYIGPKLLLFGLIAIAEGASSLFSTNVMALPPVLSWILYFLFFAVLIWYVVCSKKAEKSFW